MRHLCSGSGEPATARHGLAAPTCPVCGREFGAQGRKAYARLTRAGNPWEVIPRHYVEAEDQ